MCTKFTNHYQHTTASVMQHCRARERIFAVRNVHKFEMIADARIRKKLYIKMN